MARRKKGAAVHGWVIVDKPEGVTSTQVVGAVKRVFDAQKAGHAGTLDPMATGVLADCAGRSDQNRALRHGCREDLSLYGLLGRGARQRRCRRRGDRDLP